MSADAKRTLRTCSGEPVSGERASEITDARRATTRHRPSTSCSTCRARPTIRSPSFLTDDIGDWEKEYMLQQWWLDRMATSSDAAAGEAGALLARALRDAEREGRRHAADVPAELVVPSARARQLPRSRARDVAAARDAALPRQRPERRRPAERELRPRAHGALHPRREPVHAVRRRGLRAGVDRLQHARLRSRAVPLLLEPSRQRHEDVHGRDPELRRSRDHRLHPVARTPRRR